ncbi:MAG: nucleotide exchange factor GrpE [Planctomycetota bacterium]|nr:nucleotide exchange factor GrpE [Planctomycetota bacterium]MSR37517.1 nucleotide exchange factor GrpE [Planctomycetota bacterium]
MTEQNHDAAKPPVEKDLPELAERIRTMQTEREQIEEQLKRALADAANMRRRQSQELSDSRHRIVEGMTQELLPVLDSFRMALLTWDGRNDHTDPAALVEGVRMVQVLLSSALERNGLQEIHAHGQAFDPARHEAVAVQARPGIAAGQVLEVLQTGYLLSDRVLRHAKVLVSGESPKDTAK